MRHFKATVEAQLEAQRWNASQAAREVAALNGELGPEAQLIAMSALYAELKAQSRHDEAAALKARALNVYEAAQC